MYSATVYSEMLTVNEKQPKSLFLTFPSVTFLSFSDQIVFFLLILLAVTNAPLLYTS